MRKRVSALVGNEIVEGRVPDNRIAEVRRDNHALQPVDYAIISTSARLAPARALFPPDGGWPDSASGRHGFVSIRDLQQARFVERPADQLQTDGQSRRGKAARHADRG